MYIYVCIYTHTRTRTHTRARTHAHPYVHAYWITHDVIFRRSWLWCQGTALSLLTVIVTYRYLSLLLLIAIVAYRYLSSFPAGPGYGAGALPAALALPPLQGMPERAQQHQ